MRTVNNNTDICQKPIKRKISSYRCSQLECNEEMAKAESYSALYTPLLTSTQVKNALIKDIFHISEFRPMLLVHVLIKLKNKHISLIFQYLRQNVSQCTKCKCMLNEISKILYGIASVPAIHNKRAKMYL